MHPTAEAPGLWFFVISSNGGRAAADCAARYRDRNGGLVDLKKLDAAVAFMRQNWHMITDDESAYKPGVAERLAPVFKAAADGDPTWVDGLKKELRRYSQHIGWRVTEDARAVEVVPQQSGAEALGVDRTPETGLSQLFPDGWHTTVPPI